MKTNAKFTYMEQELVKESPHNLFKYTKRNIYVIIDNKNKISNQNLSCKLTFKFFLLNKRGKTPALCNTIKSCRSMISPA